MGERVKIISETLAWNAEAHLRRKIGEVVEVGRDGRISIRFDNGRVLRGRSINSFDSWLGRAIRRLVELGLKAKVSNE